MALVDDVKVALRVSSDAYDSEVEGLIAAAKRDLDRVGVPAEMLSVGSEDALAKMAVTLYCKAHFGYDNSEAGRFMESYRQIVADMLNSPVTYGGAHEVE